MTKTPFIIGISGKFGSGKNYLSSHLEEEFIKRGYSCQETSFAKPLKDEMTNIMSAYRDGIYISKISSQFGISRYQLNKLIGFVSDEINNYDINGFSKTNGIRRGLQYLGTDIRRRKDDSYWINLLKGSLPACDIAFIPDARFYNEADFTRKSKGINIRLEVSHEVILQRATERDKIRYSTISENHISETALDDYPNFDIIVGDTFDIVKLADKIESYLLKFKN